MANRRIEKPASLRRSRRFAVFVVASWLKRCNLFPRIFTDFHKASTRNLIVKSLFSERLIARRNNLNLTQKDLAQKSGLSESAITALERDVNPPTARTLEKLSAALGVPAAWLMGGDHMALREGGVDYDSSAAHVWRLFSERLLRAALAELIARQGDDDLALMHLEAIVGELRRRARRPAPISSPQDVEDATASVSAAEQVADSLRESSQRPGAGAPSGGTRSPSGDVSKGSKERPASPKQVPK